MGDFEFINIETDDFEEGFVIGGKYHLTKAFSIMMYPKSLDPDTPIHDLENGWDDLDSFDYIDLSHN